MRYIKDLFFFFLKCHIQHIDVGTLSQISVLCVSVFTDEEDLKIAVGF